MSKVKGDKMGIATSHDIFPNVKEFSTSNLWYMKKWYQFYEPFLKREKLQQLVGEVDNTGNMRLEQIQQIALAEEEFKLRLAEV